MGEFATRPAAGTLAGMSLRRREHPAEPPPSSGPRGGHVVLHPPTPRLPFGRDHQGWSVRDNNDDVISTGHPTRGQAPRSLGRYALRDDWALPLTVYDPHEQPTGDRLG